MIDRALAALDDLEHRGAAGADRATGDGAGVMFGLPHEFFRARTAEIDTKPTVLPGPGKLAVAMCFSAGTRRGARSDPAADRRVVSDAGHTPIGWREVPVDETSAGEMARGSAPQISQLFIRAGAGAGDAAAFDRSLFVVRRRAEREFGADVFGAEHVLPHDRLQGDADRAAARRSSTPTCATPSCRAPSRSSTRASRPTRPELGAGAAAADDRPQRRDQHRARQRQLDARPGGRASSERSATTSAVPSADRRGRSDSAAFDRVLELLVLGGPAAPTR